MANFLFTLPVLQTAAAGGGNQMVTMIITFGLIIVIFYFLIIRPQRKKQKDTQAMLSTLRKGDRVATVGGIRGVVTHVKENTVTVKVDDNTKIEFNKSAVSSVLERKESRENAEETQD
jgi:preprotein translocase subunit YajC